MDVAFQIGGMFSFEVYAVGVLGTNFKNVKILAIFDQDTAESQGLDTRAMHAQVYPSLPATTPNNPGRYNYIKILMPSGEKQILGLAWIIGSTIAVVNRGKWIVELDNLGSDRENDILKALSANNLPVTSISFQ